MKAWIVHCADEWCTLMHADTRGKAMAMARLYVDDWNDFIDFRARRFPEMDNKPFTYQDCKDAGFEYSGFEYPDSECDAQNDFKNDCRCDICEIKNIGESA